MRWGGVLERFRQHPFLPQAYLEDGVISILARAVPCGMAPGNVEEFPFPIDPLKPWVLAGQSGFVSGKVKSSASTEVWLKDQLSASPSCGLPIIQAAGP